MAPSGSSKENTTDDRGPMILDGWRSHLGCNVIGNALSAGLRRMESRISAGFSNPMVQRFPGRGYRRLD